jgi:hypothetical protein
VDGAESVADFSPKPAFDPRSDQSWLQSVQHILHLNY